MYTPISNASVDSRPATSRLRHIKVFTVASLLVATMGIMSYTIKAEADTAPASAELGEININDGFSALVKAVKPAVVNIATTSRSQSLSGNVPHFGNRNMPEMDEFMRRFFGEDFFGSPFGNPDGAPNEREIHALGSGFIVSEEGVIVTNHHVVEGADEIEIVLQDGSRYPATLKGTDKKTDIAVLEVEADRPLPYVTFGESDSAEVGDWVVAIGNPFDLGGTVTVGIISARGRDIQSGPYDDFIQIDAPINRGNSGGPLFNTRGEVIGVNSAIYSPTGGSVGIGFSIPSVMVENVVNQLLNNGSVKRGWLGVQIQDVSEEIAESVGLDDAYGALVSQVVEGSPAERAGLQAGDIIINYDGKRVDEMRDLPRLVADTSANSDISLDIWRNESKQSVAVTISESQDQEEQADSANPNSQSEDKLGLALSPLNEELRKQYSVKGDEPGVIITDIDPSSEAARRGVRVGDVIKKAGRKNVSAIENIDEAIKLALNDDRSSLLLLIEREGEVLFVAIPIK